MMSETSIFSQQLPSKIDSLIQVENFIDSLKETYNIPDEIYGNILVSLSEASNNAIHHGNKLDPNKLMTIVFTPEEDRFIFSIIDEGEGFDYENLPDPTHPDNVDKPKGRGVFIMRNLADEVEFIANGKEVKLSFNR